MNLEGRFGCQIRCNSKQDGLCKLRVTSPPRPLPAADPPGGEGKFRFARSPSPPLPLSVSPCLRVSLSPCLAKVEVVTVTTILRRFRGQSDFLFTLFLVRLPLQR